MSSHCAPDGGGRPLADAGPRPPVVALVGAPNAGKSTIFNALTGLRAKTGNYPGVTVGRAAGTCALADGRTVEVEDLPGTYSLEPISLDEQITVDLLNGRLEGLAAPEAVVVVADATTLTSSLRLLSRVVELGLPTVLALSMYDELVARGGHLDVPRLARAVGVPVVVADGRRRSGAGDLAELLTSWDSWPAPVVAPPTDPEECTAWARSVLAAASYRSAGESVLTTRVDRVLLHPVAGVVVFFAVMLAFFETIFALAAPLQDAIAGAISALSSAFTSVAGDSALARLVSDGLLGGVGSVLVFVPQIALLFVLIAAMEQLGYLSRAAFLMDRVMASVGLEGRAFVALLSSFACAIPGIMATRTMPSARERLSTMLTLPLVTCSARLPVYVLLVSMLVPADTRWLGVGGRGLVMFGLYVLGAVSMMLAARVSTLLGRGRHAVLPFTLEMPPYRLPTMRSMAFAVWMPVKGFLRKAGTIILFATVVMWALLNLPTHSDAELRAAGVDPSDSAAVTTYTMQHSVAADLGRAVGPVFEPLGFDWKVNVAVISSLAARETFVATLGQITAAEDPTDPQAALEATTYESGPDEGQPVFTAPTLAALLVFFVYALQCLSTLAVLRRETGTWRWPLSVFGIYFAIAWSMALLAHTVVGAVT
ncbi:ferrous iron transporter B [Nocardioides sp.]|uniref:ferrous iron transporter B n=1 Tax=Nocardioides sp. TaxID=35761 RepID=UPI003783567E